MNQSYQSSFKSAFFGLLLITLGLFTGCGRQEATGSVMGTATGAAIGASVAGRNNTGTGALVGGLIGHVVGSSIGRAADDEEREEQQEREERARARERALARHELERVKEENRSLKEKWCSQCNRHVTLTGANSCPTCGGDLIREKFCKMCATSFSPKSGYRYCPYCREGILLSSR